MKVNWVQYIHYMVSHIIVGLYMEDTIYGNKLTYNFISEVLGDDGKWYECNDS